MENIYIPNENISIYWLLGENKYFKKQELIDGIRIQKLSIFVISKSQKVLPIFFIWIFPRASA